MLSKNIHKDVFSLKQQKNKNISAWVGKTISLLKGNMMNLPSQKTYMNFERYW